MLLKYALGYASSLSTLVLAEPLGVYSDNTIVMDPLSLFNASVASLNVTGGEGKIHVQCDGASYGFDLDIVDCEQAKAHVPASADPVQWAERHTGWQKQIFPLPYRAMGDKALCYVQPVLNDDWTSAKANTNQVRNAAAAIRHECFSGGKLQGGIATNIGELKSPPQLKERSRWYF